MRSPSNRRNSELPEPLDLEAWKERVRSALVHGLTPTPSDADFAEAVESTRAQQMLYAGVLARKGEPRPSEHRAEELPSRIQKLQKCLQTLTDEVCREKEPVPRGEIPPPTNTGLTSHAINAWQERDNERFDPPQDRLEAMIRVLSNDRNFADLERGVRETKELLRLIICRLENIKETKGSDPLGIDRDPISKAKYNYVFQLILIFCRLRGETFDTVKIGNSESRSNPLLQFLKAAITPIAGDNNREDIWIKDETVRQLAMKIRKDFRAG